MSCEGDQTVLLTDTAGVPLGTAANPVRTDPTNATSTNVVITGQTGAVTITAADLATTAAATSASATSLAILDDWDEADRAKVNPIVGQAGVQAGAGAVTANTQRTVAATDDPGVVSLAAIKTAVELIDNVIETNRAAVNLIASQAGVQGGSGATTALTLRVVLATDGTCPNVSGNVAAGSPAAGNPVAVGGTAIVMGSAPAKVDAGDRFEQRGTLWGAAFADVQHPNSQHAAAEVTSTTPATVFSAQGAGTRWVVTAYMMTASGDNAGTATLIIKSGSTVLAKMTRCPAGGGQGLAPVKWRCGDNEAVTFETSDATRTANCWIDAYLE